MSANAEKISAESVTSERLAYLTLAKALSEPTATGEKRDHRDQILCSCV
jgi:hypothetical protein